jgi:predicted PurR-regulated permease PerM
VPILVVINITIDQTIELVDSLSSPVWGDNVNVTYVLNEINRYLADIPYGNTYQLTEEKIVETVQGVVKPVGSFLASRAVSLGSSSAEWLTRFIIFLSLLGALFPSYGKLTQLFKDLSPLDDELDQKYLDRVTAMTKAMVKGVFVIAVAQGLTTGLFLWIAGVQFLFFWIVLAIFFSILPMGANVVAIPIGVVLIVMGDIWQGVLVIVGSVLVVSNVDNVLRPRLVPKEAELSPALVLLSAFGGLQLFGFMGVIYGPVIMIFLITTVEIYLEHYRLVSQDDGLAQ